MSNHARQAAADAQAHAIVRRLRPRPASDMGVLSVPGIPCVPAILYKQSMGEGRPLEAAGSTLEQGRRKVLKAPETF
jgi:hypothetical protein